MPAPVEFIVAGRLRSSMVPAGYSLAATATALVMRCNAAVRWTVRSKTLRASIGASARTTTDRRWPDPSRSQGAASRIICMSLYSHIRHRHAVED
jgi:hypothetical protein